MARENTVLLLPRELKYPVIVVLAVGGIEPLLREMVLVLDCQHQFPHVPIRWAGQIRGIQKVESKSLAVVGDLAHHARLVVR